MSPQNNMRKPGHQQLSVIIFISIVFVLLIFFAAIIGILTLRSSLDILQAADPRTRIFPTKLQCETSTDRRCIPTICERDGENPTCELNNQKGWFATRMQQVASSPTNTQQSCTGVGGKWIAEYSECEGLREEQCQELNGNFNECASACRHDPTAEACIMLCVPVCTY
jgi:hypothetical protein